MSYGFESRLPYQTRQRKGSRPDRRRIASSPESLQREACLGCGKNVARQALVLLFQGTLPGSVKRAGWQDLDDQYVYAIKPNPLRGGKRVFLQTVLPAVDGTSKPA